MNNQYTQHSYLKLNKYIYFRGIDEPISVIPFRNLFFDLIVIKNLKINNLTNFVFLQF